MNNRTSTGKPRPDRAEHRWPGIAAVLVALVLYGLLPSEFTPLLRYSVVAVCILLVVPLVFLNPLRLRRQTPWSRWISTALVVVLALANTVALVQLIGALLTKDSDNGALLLAAAQVWVTHAIVFALLYWELDRGGPVVRSLAPRDEIPRADIRFPQDEDADNIDEVARGAAKHSGWTANFVDYLYFAFANSMAFSPPDAVPLTPRAKILVGLQALGAFVVLVLVIARAVALLG